ncbi:ABC transporter ATP-binding protein [Nocardioides sp. BGMRC 2183]|nr:ABC transporter ATP-binding protein [Nocardioides sp. BGMRC 2183]
MSTATTSGTVLHTGEDIGAWQTIRRGVRHSPELVEGIWVTLMLAVLASVGQIVVPVAVQQTIDRGLQAEQGPDVGFTALMATLAGVGLLVTSWASYKMTARLFDTSERGLATLRVKAFRHVHDLPMLTQNTERRGALVSRVTSDVDQVSQFLVFGGLLAVVSVGQILIATIVMVVYSWQLALVVWICFAPLFASLRFFQRKLSAAYGTVRRQVGVLLSAVSEPVVGAAVVRSYAIEDRTQERIDTAIDAHKAASTRAQGFTAFSFSLGGISAGLANAGVLIVGIWLGHGRLWGSDEGSITAGEVLAFAFLVTLFVGPVQMGTQILTDAQNAIAGWRRVIGILDTPADLVDPGAAGVRLPHRPVDVVFEDVVFAYPGGRPVLRDIDLSIPAGRRVAVVGETGSGKSTLAKLLTRLMDPSRGRVLIDGTDLREISEESLRARVVLVPQEGFLFDDTVAANARYGRLDATDAEISAAADALGLGDWLGGLPDGLATQVGQRGESLSAGERQLVALLRAQLADPDLLVLDEATSAVDPALEVRIGRALERLMSGRTSVTIAHRLSTAEAADEVIVVDVGRIVQQGPHAVLASEPDSTYGRLYRSWVAQQGAPIIDP